MNPAKSMWLVAIGIAAAAVLLIAALTSTALFRSVEVKANDLHFVVTRYPPPEDIVLVVVDQKAIETFPEPLLFWHRYYARAIEAVANAGARALGLDVVFPIPVESWTPGADRELAAAVLRAQTVMPVVCGYASYAVGRQKDWAVPLNLLSASLNRAAYVNLRTDEDDFVRSIQVYEVSPDNQSVAKSLALRVAEAVAGAEARLENERLILGPRRVALAADRTLRIRFPGPAGTIRRVSLADVIAAHDSGDRVKLESWFKRRIVLLGSDLPSDRHATPYYAFRLGQPANTAGVEIHAAAVWTILQAQPITAAPVAFVVAAYFGLALVGALVTLRGSGWLLGFALPATAAVAAAGSHIAFHLGWQISWLAGTATLSMAVLLSWAWRGHLVARGRTLMRSALAAFAGRTVAASVERTGAVSHSGMRREISILFSDVRGFTSFCESRPPEQVVTRLNEYFTAMIGLVEKHGGDVNKFLGDGLMALFVEGEDHALRALNCARAMAAHRGEFTTSAAVHTGWVVLGTVGSGDRMEYTALGDAVNTAARIATLHHQTAAGVLFSEATLRCLNGQVRARALGQFELKGKQERIALFTPEEDATD